jgi:7,8-dihydropterin-6-yl-methyl-4-(beta-D-ribofuranosyl)aminobenzene 5'-phosphate synthase
MEAEKKRLNRVELTVLVCDRSTYNNNLWSQFGLAILMDFSWNDESSRRVLFDTGWTAEPLLHNMDCLGVSIESIDTVFLSHSHYDHTGGLSRLLDLENARFQIVAHPDIKRPVFSTRHEFHYIGLDPSEFDKLPQSRLVLTEVPLEVHPGVWITGTIPRRTDFEKPEKGVYVLDKGKLLPDPEWDDISMAVDLGEEGLFVVTGCSHAGIINIIQACQEVTGRQVIYGVIGGLHLIDLEEEVKVKTIEMLTKLDVRNLWTGHCTGWDAEVRLQKAIGEKCRRFHTGDKLSITLEGRSK